MENPNSFSLVYCNRYANDTHHYCLHLDGGLVIDGHRMGGDGRFVNHSCEPNCEMQKWSVHGLPRMALFASRDIKPGEELTYDYNFALFNPSEGQECRCGSSACRGVIGNDTIFCALILLFLQFIHCSEYFLFCFHRWKKSKGLKKHYFHSIANGTHREAVGWKTKEECKKI